MVVRDGPDRAAPLEVLMLRRSLRADFVGGAHVFPGGALDPTDATARAERVCTGRDDAGASAILGVGSGGLAYWVAAVRECFEESGLLLARTADGAIPAFDDPGVAARFSLHRERLHARAASFLDVCEEEGLTLDVGALHYFAHWITPEGATRRYDTRFFVAAAPEHQTPTHDARETISEMWVRPADALERHRAGAMELILPTICNLQAIGRFGTAADLLAAASALGDVPAILPRVVAGSGGARVLLPGDPGYEDPAPPVPPDFDSAVRRASMQAAEGTWGSQSLSPPRSRRSHDARG